MWKRFTGILIALQNMQALISLIIRFMSYLICYVYWTDPWSWTEGFLCFPLFLLSCLSVCLSDSMSICGQATSYFMSVDIAVTPYDPWNMISKAISLDVFFVFQNIVFDRFRFFSQYFGRFFLVFFCLSTSYMSHPLTKEHNFLKILFSCK